MKFIKEYWKDPVWSKVIAAGIISLIGALFTLFRAGVIAVFDRISFTEFIQTFLNHFSRTFLILGWQLFVLVIISSTAVFFFAISLIQKIKKERQTVLISNGTTFNHLHSDVFFYYRLLDAFPGKRGLLWFDSEEAVKRLKIIFDEPFYFKPSTEKFSAEHDPIWWFRGFSSMYIDNFKVLKRDKVLINNNEYKVDRMAAFVSDSRSLNFLYIEIFPEKPSGVYEISEEYIKSEIRDVGYSVERLGLFNGKYIKGEEFDDGSTMVNGKVVRVIDGELRYKFLSRYNFIICPKDSPFNSKEFDQLSKDYFKLLLENKVSHKDFFEVMIKYSKNK